MYEQIKRLFPKRLLKKNEKFLRGIVSLGYRGNRFECTICNFHMNKFIKLENGNKICPRCGSLPRARRLWNILQSKIDNKKILHFSPSKTLQSKIRSQKDINYITTDYAGEFDADKRLNITSIDEAENTFDLIICYHVLEHIENDKEAMKELYRIAKPGGSCMIQTPFKEGEIYENEEIVTETDRLEHFGQADHVRIYSVNGLLERLIHVGFNAEVKRFTAEENNKYGLKSEEYIIIAKKPI